jgi:hemolysin activation/secretion protein
MVETEGIATNFPVPAGPRGGRMLALAILTMIAAAAFSPRAWSDERAASGDQDFVLPVVPQSAPFGGAGGSSVFVSAIEFEGNKSVPDAELQAIAAPFVKRDLRVADIEELRQRLTRHYIDKGHVNSGAVIPADALRDGVLRIRIIEGRITEVRVKGMDGLKDDYLISRLGADGETLNVNIMQERIRLLLTDPLFDRINARLLPGATLGSAVAEIDVSRARSFHAQVFANNYLAPSLGSGLIGVSGVARNVTGWGDALEATVQANGDTNHYDLAWSLPILAGPTVLDLRFGRGASAVVEEPFSQLNIRSNVSSQQIGISHPFFAETRRQLNLGVTYGERRNSTTLDGEPFSFTPGEIDGKTTVRDWSFYQDLVHRFDRHVLAMRSTFVWGRNNLSDLPLTGKPPRNYSLWVGQIQTVSNLTDTGVQLIMRGNLQYTSDHLVPLERLGIGGRYSVRGYRENQLVRDSGYILSAEIVYPVFSNEAEKQRLAIVPFLDLGRGANEDEPANRLASIGVGFQGRWGGLEGELFLAKRLKTLPTEPGSNLQDRGIHLQVRYAFL